MFGLFLFVLFSIGVAGGVLFFNKGHWMIGLNRPKGINIKNNIELNYLRQSGKMLKSVKKIIKNNIEEGITTKELDYIAEK